MLSKKSFDKWTEKDSRSNLYKLIKANRMVFDAWETRGYQYAEDTDMDNYLSFEEQLKKAVPLLNQVQGYLKTDAYNILIKAHKGLGQPSESKRAFENCIATERNHIQAHLAYLDVILPKWYGDDEQVEAFKNKHKHKTKLLGYLLEAKVLNELEDHTLISSFLTKNELDIKQLKTDNPNKYILYNYLYFFADALENKKLSKRYEHRLSEYLSSTLYSPLRSREEIKEKLG